MTNEIWKDLKGYGSKYEVSNTGNVRLKETKKVLNQHTHRKYKYVALYYNGKTHTCRVHRLIAQEFCEAFYKECIVMHLDNNPANNCANNLKCGTQRENILQCCNENRIHIPGLAKKTEQYDLKGNFIKLWDSQTLIEKTLGYSQSRISDCCIGKRKKAYGYIWKYADKQ